MKNARNFAICLSAGLLAASAWAAAGTTDGPLIQFDDAHYNFGKVSAGEPVKHTYYVTNTGTSSLTISNVHPSCGCTTAHPWTRVIEPGQSGAIPIQFNSTHYSGQVMKTIDVYSNAKNLPHATLHLTGLVWKPIYISPGTAFINISEDASNAATATVRIINQSDTPLTISDVEPSSKHFTAQLQEVKPGKEYHLLVSALPPFDVGNTPGSISMKTSIPSMPHISVTVMAIRREAVQVSPPRVMISPAMAHWTTNSVFIANFDYPGFQLSDPLCSDNSIHVSVQRLHPQRAMYNLWIAVPPNYHMQPGKPVEVVVKTNHPRHPSIRIPIYQLPDSRAYFARPNAFPIANHP